MQYGAFFNMCRLQGIAFDLQERLGTAFMLVDSLAGGMLGTLGVGRSHEEALRKVSKALGFIQEQALVPPYRFSHSDDGNSHKEITREKIWLET